MKNMDNTDNYNAWDLFRRGQIDQEKHIKILRDYVKRNITDLITHGEIISDGNIKFPIKHLRQWKFEYEDSNDEGTAVIDGDPQEGDVLGQKPSKGKQGQGGDGEGDEGYYEVVVNADVISEHLFEEMELYNLRKKQAKDAFKEEYVQDSISKKGIMPNLNKRRTILQNIKRNAAKGNPRFKDVIDDDLRYRSDTVKQIPQDKVVVFFLRDRSGSMDSNKKHLSRVLSFWIIKFLKYKYKDIVENVYITFDTSAQEVSEEDFIHKSQGGGTYISSGFRLTKEIIDERYNPEFYNIYVFCFTDGDNFSNDDRLALDYITQVSMDSNLIGVAHIGQQDFYGWDNSKLINGVKKLEKEKDNILVAEIDDQEDVLRAMKQFFKGGGDKSE